MADVKAIGFPEGALESHLQSFDNYKELRKRWLDQVREAVSSSPETKNEKYTLRLKDIKYDTDKDPTPEDHRLAVVTGKSLTRKLTGTYDLIDNTTGKSIAKTSKRTIMNVPVLTDLGTFVRNGVEYGFPKQLRLASTVYGRTTADGYPEAQFNIKPLTGRAFRIQMDPETSVFYLHSGGRKVPLYSVLKTMGVEDKDIEETWGKDILNKNRSDSFSPHAAKWIEDAATRGLKNIKEPVADTELNSTFAEPSEGTVADA